MMLQQNTETVQELNIQISMSVSAYHSWFRLWIKVLWRRRRRKMCKQWIRGVQVFCKRHLGFSFLDLHKDKKKKRRIVNVGLTTKTSAAQPSDTSSCHVHVAAKLCSNLCDRLTNLQLQREKSAVKTGAGAAAEKTCRASAKRGKATLFTMEQNPANWWQCILTWVQQSIGFKPDSVRKPVWCLHYNIMTVILVY